MSVKLYELPGRESPATFLLLVSMIYKALKEANKVKTVRLYLSNPVVFIRVDEAIVFEGRCAQKADGEDVWKMWVDSRVCEHFYPSIVGYMSSPYRSSLDYSAT